MRIIPMPISEDYQTVICHTDGKGATRKQTRILMTPISYKEESQLDRGHNIDVTRGGITFHLGKDNVLAYGEVDFHTGSEDYEHFEDLIDYKDIVHIPVNYDYDTHTCKTDTKMYKTCESTNIADMCQYAHGRLGKPQRVAIFRLTV